MPNLKSAKKRLRQNERCAEVNKRIKTRVKSTRKELLEAVAGTDDAAKSGAYSSYCSALDKAVKGGVIKKNNAIRNKTRAARMVKHGLPEAPRKKSKRKKEQTPKQQSNVVEPAVEAAQAEADAAGAAPEKPEVSE